MDVSDLSCAKRIILWTYFKANKEFRDSIVSLWHSEILKVASVYFTPTLCCKGYDICMHTPQNESGETKLESIYAKPVLTYKSKLFFKNTRQDLSNMRECSARP